MIPALLDRAEGLKLSRTINKPDNPCYTSGYDKTCLQVTLSDMWKAWFTCRDRNRYEGKRIDPQNKFIVPWIASTVAKIKDESAHGEG